ncbi:MBL fold metallo-hydrolase [Bdellovibrio bacteriovorus]|nr:MBL fold metallo-hydrolase [Bdellovibrio bacteriovorus]
MSVQISRILHAGYLFECNDFKIAFDPLFENPFSRNCYAFPSIEFDLAAVKDLNFDAVFISHYHDDHFSLESLNLLKRETPIYIFSIFEELIELIKDLGFKDVHAVELLRPIHLGPFEIMPLEALDADVDSIYHIKVEGRNILNVVDSWIGPRTMDRLRQTTWDLVMWPMQTMREIEVLAPASAEPVTPETLKLPIELIEQLQELKPKAVIPSACQFRFEDWSWYNHAFFPITYAQFEKQVQEILPQAKVLRLNPGKSLLLTDSDIKYSDRLPWIKPVGDQEIDYEFKPELPPQSIADIAQRLPSLDEKQKNRVHDFCTNALISRYPQLSAFEESYFQNKKIWRLTTYDHYGEAKHYFYEVYRNQVTIASTSISPTWITEIPEVKIYNALEDGESLTSIYVRVTNPKDSDPLEDPLIRSLYEGLVGGYQKAQLKKLGLRK